jgi:ABC-type sugar transport system ATPase subunit
MGSAILLSYAPLRVITDHRDMAIAARRFRISTWVLLPFVTAFMDEPASGLDPRTVEDFITHVKAFNALGGAVLLTTHDLFKAIAIGTRLGIMRRGELVHTLDTGGLSATDLQKLYLETI